MTTQLPFELLAHIIDFVVEDAFSHNNKVYDTTDLRQCALVSPALTVLCQKHLFSDIRISHDKPWAILNLQQVLEIDHPEIGSYIKSLSVTLRSPAYRPQPNIDCILDKCTEIASLALSCHQDSGIRWVEDIPKSTQMLLESIIHSPMCKALDFDGIQMPFSVFSTPRRSCAVESLSFSRTSFAIQQLEAPGSEIGDQGPTYSSLRFLSLVPSLIPSLLSARSPDGRHLFDLSNLETLWVDHSSSGDQPSVTAQLLRQTTRLRTLGFRFMSTPPSLLREVLSEPARCFTTTLSEIRLKTSSHLYWVVDLPNKDPFWGTLDGLHVALSNRNVLKLLYVEMDLDGTWIFGTIVQDRWIRAADTFKHPRSSFPLLQQFTIDIMAPARGKAGDELADKLLKVPFDTLDLPYKFTFSARSR